MEAVSEMRATWQMKVVGREESNELPYSVISISTVIRFAVRGTSQLFWDKIRRREERYTA